jgi:type IV secretion system protein VirB4
LGLGDIALSLTAASSKADQNAIARLFKKHGHDGFFVAWLKHRNCSWAVDLISTLDNLEKTP